MVDASGVRSIRPLRAIVEVTLLVLGASVAVSVGMATTVDRLAGVGSVVFGLAYWAALRVVGRRSLARDRRAPWDGFRDLPLPEELAAWFAIVTVVVGTELVALGEFSTQLGNVAAGGFVGIAAIAHIALQRHFHPAVTEPPSGMPSRLAVVVDSGREAVELVGSEGTGARVA